jgi:hypothetical protein
MAFMAAVVVVPDTFQLGALPDMLFSSDAAARLVAPAASA